MPEFPERSKHEKEHAGVCLLDDSRAAQIVEFAVALPLLVVLVVGIFDFGFAFGVKQKVSNAAREGARVAASQPTIDLSLTPAGGCGAPTSICAVRDVVNNYLAIAKVNNCGLDGATASPGGSLANGWSFSSTGTCSDVLTLKIERGYTFSSALPAPYSTPLTVEATRLTLIYPYKWQFNRVMSLVVTGATYSDKTKITIVSVMQNLN